MLMIETLIDLDISCNRRIERLPMRNDPVQNGSFQTFCVVGLGTGDSLL